jgi:homoserine kinase
MVNSGDRIVVKVPGSIANLRPGFDVFALSLKAPHDLLTSLGAGVKTVAPFAR